MTIWKTWIKLNLQSDSDLAGICNSCDVLPNEWDESCLLASSTLGEDDLIKPNQELWFSIQLRVRQEVWSTNLSEVDFGRNEKEMGWQIRSSIPHLKNQRVHVSQIRRLRQNISINPLLNNNQNNSISFPQHPNGLILVYSIFAIVLQLYFH